MSYNFINKITDPNYMSRFDPLFRTHMQEIFTEITDYADTKVSNNDIVTIPTANKILRLDTNGKFPLTSTGVQVKQVVTITDSYTFNFSNLYQFSLVTILIATGDNQNTAKATFIIKDFVVFTMDLVGAKVFTGVITSLTMTGVGTAIATVSVPIVVRCSMNVVNLGGDIA